MSRIIGEKTARLCLSFQGRSLASVPRCWLLHQHQQHERPAQEWLRGFCADCQRDPIGSRSFTELCLKVDDWCKAETRWKVSGVEGSPVVRYLARAKSVSRIAAI